MITTTDHRDGRRQPWSAQAGSRARAPAHALPRSASRGRLRAVPPAFASGSAPVAARPAARSSGAPARRTPRSRDIRRDAPRAERGRRSGSASSEVVRDDLDQLAACHLLTLTSARHLAAGSSTARLALQTAVVTHAAGRPDSHEHGDKRDHTHSASSDPRAREASQPIANYGLLADCNSAALVDRDGSIDWLCLPRYDSDAIFARLLDPDAGHWSIRPARVVHGERRYLPARSSSRRSSRPRPARSGSPTRWRFAEGQRGHELGYDAPHELLRSVEGVSGEVELRLELAPRPQYGLVKPLIRLEDGGARTFGAGRISVALAPRRSRSRTRRCARRSPSPRASASGSPCAGHRAEDAERAGAHGARGGRRADRRHRRGLALLGGRARHLRGPAPRARAHELARAQGAELPAHRRDRGGADDLASGDRGRRAQLGLPLLLDPRLEPHDRGALHRHLLGRGRGVRLVHDQLRRRARGRGLAPDHVRDRRRARPLGARAAAPARLARLAPGAGRQRRLGPGRSSTSTASC